jgi:tetratricopeptide (TPR) repeat protein
MPAEEPSPRSRASPWALGLAVTTLLVLLAWGLSVRPRRPGETRAAAGDAGPVFTLYVLGGSTAWGEPYNPRADLGLVASWFLGGEIAGRPIRVVNRGGPGKASSGVVEDAREIARAPHEPGTAVALLYVGNNEFLRFDRHHDLSRNERALFDVPTTDAEERRQALEDHARNLEEIVAQLLDAGVGVIASTVAVNLKDWEPNRSVLRDPASRAAVEGLLADGERAWAAGRPEEALAAYAAVLGLEPGFAWASKRAGDCERALGRGREARASYQDAVDHDGNPYRETSEQARILREACARHAVPLVDAVGILEAASPEGLIGYELLWDNCHPTLEGYARIAAGFADVLVERHGARRQRTSLDLAALERDLGLDDAFQSQVLASRGQYCYVSSALTWDPLPRLARGEACLSQAMALVPESPDLLCSLAILRALQGQPQRSLAEWRRAYALDPRVTRQRAKLTQVEQVMRRVGIERLPALLKAGY